MKNYITRHKVYNLRNGLIAERTDLNNKELLAAYNKVGWVEEYSLLLSDYWFFVLRNNKIYEPEESFLILICTQELIENN